MDARNVYKRNVGAFLAAMFAFGSLGAVPQIALATGTPAGTAVSNQASVSYSDGNGNPFTATSNTVTTNVQDAPSVTVVGVNTANTVPGGQYDAVFTVTNTGNGTGNINLTFGADTGNDASFATQQAFQAVFPTGSVIGTATTGCTVTGKTVLCDTAAHLATQVSASTVPQNTAITVTVPTNVANGATAGAAGANTIVTPLAATVTYTAANNANTTGSSTSTSANSTSTASVLADARLDIQKNVLAPGATGNPSSTNFLYTLYAANGGSAPARDLPSVKTLLGSSAAGIFVSDKVPTYVNNTPVTQLTVASVSATAGGALVSSGATTSIYYSNSATGAAGTWSLYSGSGALPSGTTFVGVLVSGGAGGTEIGGNSNATSGGGSANAPTASTAQVTITLQITPPNGAGSGNTNSVVNQADSVVGGNQPNLAPVTGVTNQPQNVIGPNIPANTTDSTTAIDSGTQGILYPTQAAGTASTQGGASNAIGTMTPVSAAVYDGPFGNPQATGNYTGGTATNNADFTALAFTPTGFNPTNTSSTGVAGNATTASATIQFSNSLQNVGNAVDNLSVTVTAPAGWGVQIYAENAAGTVTGGVLAGSTTSNSATYTFANVPSGAPTDTANIQNYAVVYTVPAGSTAFTPYDSTATVTSVNTPSQTNQTHNEIVVGGPVALYKSQALDPTTCPNGSAIPGCIITYTINYVNNAEAATACPGTAPTTVPAYAGGFYAKGVTISENGATAPSTWGATYTTATGGTAQNTKGLNAPATDPVNSGTTFTTNTAGSYAFTALVGGSNAYILAPGCSGRVTFSVTVNNQ